jgi:hypothetical protein
MRGQQTAGTLPCHRSLSDAVTVGGDEAGTATHVAAVISSPLWGVSDVALGAFELRGGRVILSGVYDAPEAMSPM